MTELNHITGKICVEFHSENVACLTVCIVKGIKLHVATKSDKNLILTFSADSYSQI